MHLLHGRAANHTRYYALSGPRRVYLTVCPQTRPWGGVYYIFVTGMGLIGATRFAVSPNKKSTVARLSGGNELGF